MHITYHKRWAELQKRKVYAFQYDYFSRDCGVCKHCFSEPLYMPNHVLCDSKLKILDEARKNNYDPGEVYHAHYIEGRTCRYYKSKPSYESHPEVRKDICMDSRRRKLNNYKWKKYVVVECFDIKSGKLGEFE